MSYPPPPGQNPYGQPQQPQQPYGYPQQQPPPQPGYGYPQQQAPNPYAQQVPGQQVPGQQVPGQQGYGYPQQQQQPYGYNPAAVPPSLAGWLSRVGGYVIDGILASLPALVLAGIGGAILGGDPENGAGPALIAIGYLATFGMFLWFVHMEGTTGQSPGKRAVGIRVLREADGRPLGFGMAFARKLCHFLDSIACYLGWLWPLWDAKKQTFADKIVSSLVVRA